MSAEEVTGEVTGEVSFADLTDPGPPPPLPAAPTEPPSRAGLDPDSAGWGQRWAEYMNAYLAYWRGQPRADVVAEHARFDRMLDEPPPDGQNFMDACEYEALDAILNPRPGDPRA